MGSETKETNRPLSDRCQTVANPEGRRLFIAAADRRFAPQAEFDA